MPDPAYENTLYAFVEAPLGTEEGFQNSADTVLGLVAPGPYARVGLASYFVPDMPWNADLTAPALSSPTREWLVAILERARARGLAIHMSLDLGMSRVLWAYADAKREDRRNYQWYDDGAIKQYDTMSDDDATLESFATPSRYARKLRGHMEAKVRAFAAMFLSLQAEYPDTLISASGDAEGELAFRRPDPNPASGKIIVADYGPFAILEFRDWLLHTGLYAPGGPYAGQGYRKKRSETFQQGSGALTAENLARFNADFDSAFTSWNLEYFHWSLADPVEGDRKAIPFSRYSRPAWSPLPERGSGHIAGGFDAPRGSKDPSTKLWKVWRRFRQQMIANYVNDVSTWMRTTPALDGSTLSPDRWYSHQYPGDYLSGTYPGHPKPIGRLFSGASPLWTAMIPSSLGSPGMTVLDVLGRGGYFRTSRYLFAAMERLGPRNWGMPEYSPSWHIDTAPEQDLERIREQYRRAYEAGAHMFGYVVWEHFWTTNNGAALGAFLAEVRDQPRTPFYLAREPFVRRLYSGFLGREPDPDGELSLWTGALSEGETSRARLAADMAGWPEVQRGLGTIARYYLGILGRAPAWNGLQTWTARLLAGGCSGSECSLARRQEIVDSFVASGEFRARFAADLPTRDFVVAMFRAILGRRPSPAERKAYAKEINAGRLTRAAMVRQLVESAELMARSWRDVFVVLEYAGLLGRAPSAGDLATWSGRLTGGLSPATLAQVFLASPEYAARFD